MSNGHVVNEQESPTVARTNQKELIMEKKVTDIDVEKLSQRLQLVRAKNLVAILLGDCHAVAKLTCQAARLRDAIRLSGAVVM